MNTINEKTYNSISDWFLNHKKFNTLLMLVYKISPIIIFVSYISLIIYLWILFDYRIAKVLIIPALVFTGVSVFRKIYKSKRPYELYNIQPLVVKDKIGHSMPSRHTASAFIIALSCIYINIYIGIILIVISLIIAVSRVICGVHFIRDVFIGALISIVAGILGFFII